MKHLRILVLLLVLFQSTAFSLDKRQFKDGDLIFIQTESSQSEALKEATASPWTHVGVLFFLNGNWLVAEAAFKVGFVTVEKFIKRSPGKQFIVKRVKNSVYPIGALEAAKLGAAYNVFTSKPYDFYFEWSNENIYCSELVYKMYYNALGLRIGKMQLLRELHLNGPAVQELIRKRFINEGRQLNLDEPIVSPISMLTSPSLDTVMYKID